MNSETLMSDEEFLEDRRRSLRESIEYFSAKNKAGWVCLEFVQNLRVNFDETEIVYPNDDPPDVIFRDARSKSKESLIGWARQAEWNASLQEALATLSPMTFCIDTPKESRPHE